MRISEEAGRDAPKLILPSRIPHLLQRKAHHCIAGAGSCANDGAHLQLNSLSRDIDDAIFEVNPYSCDKRRAECIVRKSEQEASFPYAAVSKGQEFELNIVALC